MWRLLEQLLGLAAVVGIRELLRLDRPPPIEIDPVTGRETLLSMITHQQHKLKAPWRR